MNLIMWRDHKLRQALPKVEHLHGALLGTRCQGRGWVGIIYILHNIVIQSCKIVHDLTLSYVVVYDQIRQSIAYSHKNVKICASHAGLTLGEDGATHQILEDIGMMKMLPNMTVIVPADFNQTKQATIAIADLTGPVYLRFGRPSVPIFVKPDADFQIGKADVIMEGTDVTIIACGHLVWKSIEAARELAEKGISAEVINMHTIKPLDTEAVLRSVAKTKCVVTAEEHMINGGLGDSIAQVLTRNNPLPQEYVGVNDTFGESGTPAELMTKYGIDTRNVVQAALKVIERK